MTPWLVIVIVYQLASRLAYVLWVGIMLKREDRDHALTRAFGVEGGFQRFRRRASWVMTNDAFALILLCTVTRGSLPDGLPAVVTWGLGSVMIVVGIGVKVWAARTLGDKAYYWYNFFNPAPATPLQAPGPYRYLDNPMYTLGYLQAYGMALALLSWPGLVGALFAQLSILTFHHLVEKPHFQTLRLTSAPVAESRTMGR